MMFLYLLPLLSPFLSVPADARDLSLPSLVPPRPYGAVRREGGAQRLEVERARQAQSPREGPPPLRESEAFGPRVHIGTASREAPSRVRPDARSARIGRHRDDTEQQVLRTPFPASHAHAHGDVADYRRYRQASHNPFYCI
jgi:hypothetical protein